MKNKNTSLFWYGFLAGLQMFGGAVIIMGGLLFSFYIASIFQNAKLMNVFCIFLIAGIYVGMTGKAKRFDYQRRSGYIMHQGDGW